jgi:hypothetical protein
MAAKFMPKYKNCYIYNNFLNIESRSVNIFYTFLMYCQIILQLYAG